MFAAEAELIRRASGSEHQEDFREGARRDFLQAVAHFAAALEARPRARIVIEASTDSEWVARCL